MGRVRGPLTRPSRRRSATTGCRSRRRRRRRRPRRRLLPPPRRQRRNLPRPTRQARAQRLPYRGSKQRRAMRTRIARRRPASAGHGARWRARHPAGSTVAAVRGLPRPAAPLLRRSVQRRLRGPPASPAVRVGARSSPDVGVGAWRGGRRERALLRGHSGRWPGSALGVRAGARRGRSGGGWNRGRKRLESREAESERRKRKARERGRGREREAGEARPAGEGKGREGRDSAMRCCVQVWES